MKTKKIIDLYKDDFWSQGKLELKDELLTPDFLFSSPAQVVEGSEAVAGYLSYLRSVFPNLHFETHDTIIEGDRVASIWTLYGTQEQEFMGFPAQGQEVALPGVSIMDISEGRLSQEQVYWDRLTLLEQLQLSTEPA